MFPMTKEDYDKNEFALNATWTSFTSKKKTKKQNKTPKITSIKVNYINFAKLIFL